MTIAETEDRVIRSYNLDRGVFNQLSLFPDGTEVLIEVCCDHAPDFDDQLLGDPGQSLVKCSLRGASMAEAIPELIRACNLILTMYA